jgi:hypothetical protein
MCTQHSLWTEIQKCLTFYCQRYFVCIHPSYFIADSIYYFLISYSSYFLVFFLKASRVQCYYWSIFHTSAMLSLLQVGSCSIFYSAILFIAVVGIRAKLTFFFQSYQLYQLFHSATKISWISVFLICCQRSSAYTYFSDLSIFILFIRDNGVKSSEHL